MGFKFVRHLAGGNMPPVAPPKDTGYFTMKAAETATAGVVYKFHTDGTLTKASGADVLAAVIALEDAPAGGTFRGEWIVPGAVYETVLTGAVDAGLIAGAVYDAKLDANGAGVDATATTGGCMALIKVDTTAKTALVVFTKCFLNPIAVVTPAQ